MVAPAAVTDTHLQEAATIRTNKLLLPQHTLHNRAASIRHATSSYGSSHAATPTHGDTQCNNLSITTVLHGTMVWAKCHPATNTIFWFPTHPLLSLLHSQLLLLPNPLHERCMTQHKAEVASTAPRYQHLFHYSPNCACGSGGYTTRGRLHSSCSVVISLGRLGLGLPSVSSNRSTHL